MKNNKLNSLDITYGANKMYIKVMLLANYRQLDAARLPLLLMVRSFYKNTNPKLASEFNWIPNLWFSIWNKTIVVPFKQPTGGLFSIGPVLLNNKQLISVQVNQTTLLLSNKVLFRAIQSLHWISVYNKFHTLYYFLSCYSELLKYINIWFLQILQYLIPNKLLITSKPVTHQTVKTLFLINIQKL